MHGGGGLGEDEEGEEEGEGLAGGGGHGGGQGTEFLGEGCDAGDAEVAAGAEDEEAGGGFGGFLVEEDEAFPELHGEKAVDEEEEGAEAVGVEDEFVVRRVIFPQGEFLEVDDGGVDCEGHTDENDAEGVEGRGDFDVRADEEDQPQGKEGDDDVVLDLVAFFHVEHADDHGGYDTGGFKEHLGGVVEPAHGEVGQSLHGRLEGG